jgi:starch synthase
VHLTAELWPFARTGGLGEAVAGLAVAQAAAGLSTTLVMPLYRGVRETTASLECVGGPIAVTVGGRVERVSLYRAPDAGAGPRTFFIEHPGLFDRPGIYGSNGSDYPDNALRFAVFCAAAVAVLPEIAPAADVLHAHDWHTALAPAYLRTKFAESAFHSRLATVLSVHNAGFQGHFAPAIMAELGLPDHLYNPEAFEWYGRLNLLKGGLAFSDIAVTVSPNHARELLTAEGGFGLQGTFAARGDRLVGILNGIDTELWNPTTDPDIAARYSIQDLSGKAQCKAALQQACGLPQRDDLPLFGMSARLVSQKGLDLILDTDLPAMPDAQYIFLGAGERRYEAALTELAAAAPDRIAVELAFTDRLEHRLLAGADLLLMPSLYEPCGLTQMRAQRYGAIPLARRVGGLSDSIEHGETGFLFDDYAPASLTRGMREALDRYHDRAAWGTMVRHAMSQPVGWETSARRYLDLYACARAARQAPCVAPSVGWS